MGEWNFRLIAALVGFGFSGDEAVVPSVEVVGVVEFVVGVVLGVVDVGVAVVVEFVVDIGIGLELDVAEAMGVMQAASVVVGDGVATLASPTASEVLVMGYSTTVIVEGHLRVIKFNKRIETRQNKKMVMSRNLGLIGVSSKVC